MSFITPAYAQTAAGGSSALSMLLPLVAIFVIMYFLIIRPQRVQMKKHQEMINAVRRGDSVVTGGGFIGKVTKVFDDVGEVEVEVAENVRVRVLRSTLANVRAKTDVAVEKTEKVVGKKSSAKSRSNKQASANDETMSEADSSSDGDQTKDQTSSQK